MRFTKMQGLGNDYIYVEGAAAKLEDPAAVAREISDRHFGVGADGLILVLASRQADVRMRIFNADGSEAQMCGNGIRCVAKYAFERGLSKANPMQVETAAGVKTVEMRVEGGRVVEASVDMGLPIIEPAAIPVNIPQRQVVDMPVRTTRHAFQMTCVSMGNPHAVMYVADLDAVPLDEVGPELERNPLFPERINAHFVKVLGRGEVAMRTWERGSGATLACGTGASAVCVAGVLTRRTDRRIVAHLPGGDLELEWRERDNRVTMTGPAETVFTGVWPGEIAKRTSRK